MERQTLVVSVGPREANGRGADRHTTVPSFLGTAATAVPVAIGYWYSGIEMCEELHPRFSPESIDQSNWRNTTANTL
jgi:hypothetical protein